jgi:hypothetical protein
MDARAEVLTALAERLPEVCPKPWPSQGKSRILSARADA